LLNILRKKKTAKKIWIVLAIIIVPAFVFWGSGSLMRSDKEEPLYIGKIFDKKISPLEYKEARDAVRTQMIMQFGDNFSQMEKFLNLDAQAMDRLILLHEAKERKISASDKEVIAAIANSPYFWRKGRFDNKMYDETLRYAFRIQARAFEEQMRQNLMLSKLYREITKDILVSDEEAKKDYQKANEEITLYYLAAAPDEFAKNILPSEEEIKSYFEKNSLDFKQPLSFNLEYITSGSEEKIKNLSVGLNKKIELDKLLKDTGMSLKETGLFSLQEPIPGIGWSAEVLNLLPKLIPGEFSAIFQLDKNFYLFRLKDKKESYIPEFAQIKDKVKDALIKQKAKELAKAKAEEALKQAKESAGFTKIAQDLGLKADVTKPFKFGSYIEGIGASDSFWSAAEKLKEEETYPSLIETTTGFYIVKLKARSSFDETKFAQEKEEFTKKLASQKQEEFFSKFLEELKKKSQKN